jgi:SAM-dependent methyltransferase
LSLRRRLGAALDERLQLLAPARRLRFELTIEALEEFADGQTLRILDAGCGDGLLAEALARRHPDWRIAAADLRDELLERGRTRVVRAGITNVEFVHADLTEDLGDGVYDAVAAIECLEEVVEDERALGMMAKALRPGGLLAAHVPERDWKPALSGSETTWRDEVRHGYLPGELAEELGRAGLSVVEIDGTCRSGVRLAQELRDRIKDSPVWLRALVFPLMVAAVRLERRGVTWGHERALFAVARRPPAAD